MFSSGDCIFIDTNSYEDGSPKAHLFVIIFNTLKASDQTLLFPFDKIPEKAFYDKTTKIKKNEHDFIASPTYVNYYYGRIETQTSLERMIMEKTARRRQPHIGEEIYQRICYGIQRTPHIPPFLREFYVSSLFGSL